MAEEFYLLHNEIILVLAASENINGFKVSYAAPMAVQNQQPLFIEIKNDTSEKISQYYIKDDAHFPNKIIEFEITDCKKDEKIKIHFEYFVLVKNETYEDLPEIIDILHENMPNEVKTWLTATKSVQSESIFLKLLARLFNGFGNNLIKTINKIIIYTPFHLYFLQLLRLFLETNPILRPIFLPKKYFTGLMDATSYFFFGGLCAAQANFSAALLRANGIPTRILIVTMFGRVFFKGEKTWLDSHHYMLEIYCPGYGWIKGTPGKFPHQPKNYVILRVLYPEDENIAGNGLSYYGGMAPWFWISNKNVSLLFPESIKMIYKKPYGDVSGVPAIRLWCDRRIKIDSKQANELLEISNNVWKVYINILGVHLDNKHGKIFEKTVADQKKAISHLKNNDITNCIKILNDVLIKYKQIVRKSNSKENLHI